MSLSSDVDLSQNLRGQGQSGQAIRLENVFGAENGLFGHFRLFSFSAESEFSFSFYFSFSFQNVICVGPKMLCTQLNRN